MTSSKGDDMSVRTSHGRDPLTPEDMTAEQWQAEVNAQITRVRVNDIVIFSPRAGETAEGIVTRVWDKPASDPYVTVRTTEDEGRTFVRCGSEVQPVASKPRGLYDLPIFGWAWSEDGKQVGA